MAVRTSGANVSVMPGVNYLDPRLLAPAYASLAPALAQGADLVGDFFRIREAADQRPLRKRAAEIQLQEAENRLLSAPLAQEMERLRIQEAQRKLAIPERVVDEISLTGGDTRTTLLNPDAKFGELEFGTEVTPLGRVTIGREIGAGGEISPFRTSEMLKTGEQLRMEREAASALSGYRTSLAEAAENRAATAAEAATAKAETDRIRALAEQQKAEIARMRVEAELNDPKWRTQRAGADPVTGELILNQVSVDGDIRQVRTGQLFSPSTVSKFMGGLGGAGASRAQGGGVDVVSILDSVTGNGGTAPAVTEYASVQLAETAIQSGKHKKGDKIRVGSRTFTVQE